MLAAPAETAYSGHAASVPCPAALPDLVHSRNVATAAAARTTEARRYNRQRGLGSRGTILQDVGHDDDWEELRSAAQQAAAVAYARYSRFSVGAALRTETGHIYWGANIENSSYGLAVCAERVAIWQAVLNEPDLVASSRPVVAAIVATDIEGTILSPCGSCRQVIQEFGPGCWLWLPTGKAHISKALADPFRAVIAETDVAVQPQFHAARDLAIDERILKLLALPSSDSVFLVKQLENLRNAAADLYASDIDVTKTRSMLFVKTGRGLIVAPGFFSNFDDPDERAICVPLRHGITGAAYSLGRPNCGVPGHSGVLQGDLLPDSEQVKVAKELKWVVGWPLGRFGVVSLDGYDDLSSDRMRDLMESPQLTKRIDLIADLTKWM
jgi:cytidine deaminase